MLNAVSEKGVDGATLQQIDIWNLEIDVGYLNIITKKKGKKKEHRIIT